eukprot:2717687-Amphidinium_carterae.1
MQRVSSQTLVPAKCVQLPSSPQDNDLIGKGNTGVVYLNVYHLNDKWLKANHLVNSVSQVGGAYHAGGAHTAYSHAKEKGKQSKSLNRWSLAILIPIAFPIFLTMADSHEGCSGKPL